MSIYEELCKLHSARRDAGAPDTELETLVKALHQLEGNTEAEAIRPVGHPLTKEGIQKWAESRASELNLLEDELGTCTDQSVLVQILADKFAEDCRTWSYDELVDLVCSWDLEGCRGWMQYPIDELIEAMLEEATEINSDSDEKITTVEQLVEVLENW